MHRRIEIDLLRTLAIILMVAYHAAYDLATFYGWNIPIFDGGWLLLGRSAAILFLLLVGVSFVLSWKRNPNPCPACRQAGPIPLPKKYLLRGLKIFGLGMLLTVGSYFFDPETFIRFGILHCIGISILLLPFAMVLRSGALALGIGVLLLGWMFGAMHASSEILLPLNIVPLHFASMDFFPLLPWSGVVLIGAGLGWMIYGNRPKHVQATRYKLTALTWPGRHALGIYFLHQPVIMTILVLGFGLPRS